MEWKKMYFCEWVILNELYIFHLPMIHIPKTPLSKFALNTMRPNTDTYDLSRLSILLVHVINKTDYRYKRYTLFIYIIV